MREIQLARVGVIGLGRMGSGMAASLLKAGYGVSGYDPRGEACAAFASAGGNVAAGNRELVDQCDVVLTSLVAPVYLELAERLLVPQSRPRQVFIDTSTVPAPDTRRLAREFAARGAVALDAPVTGGPAAAANGALRMFVGGDRAAYERCLPMLEALCRPGGVIYGGEAGKGQVLKIVQQLRNRITDAVRLEVIAFGVRAGLTLEQIRLALDLARGGDDPYEKLIAAIEQGQGEQCDLVFAEWPYYLEEAREQAIAMPALESLYRFCRDSEQQQDAGRRWKCEYRLATHSRFTANHVDPDSVACRSSS